MASSVVRHGGLRGAARQPRGDPVAGEVVTRLPAQEGRMMAEFDETMCPICGAWSRRSCDMEEELGVCPWEESQPDPDILREDRDERRRIEKEFPHD